MLPPHRKKSRFIRRGSIIVNDTTVTVGAAVKLIDLYTTLRTHNKTLMTVPFITSITVGGAVATNSHGYGPASRTFASEFISAVVYIHGEKDLSVTTDKTIILGTCGRGVTIVNITLPLIDDVDVVERVYQLHANDLVISKDSNATHFYNPDNDTVVVSEIIEQKNTFIHNHLPNTALFVCYPVGDTIINTRLSSVRCYKGRFPNQHNSEYFVALEHANTLFQIIRDMKVARLHGPVEIRVARTPYNIKCNDNHVCYFNFICRHSIYITHLKHIYDILHRVPFSVWSHKAKYSFELSKL